MGLVYVLHWPLFGELPEAAFIASTIPAALTLGIASVGLGLRTVWTYKLFWLISLG